jgi:hypothetical protein
MRHKALRTTKTIEIVVAQIDSAGYPVIGFFSKSGNILAETLS